jgi:hypothetical protein
MSKEKEHLESLLETLRSDDIKTIILVMLNFDYKELKYNEEELTAIEDKINEMYPQGHKPLPTTLIPFGFYLGELLRKKIPGSEWKIPDEKDVSVWDMCIEFKNTDGGKMQAHPFRRIEKFWKNRDERMVSFIRMICFNSEVMMDKEYWSKRVDEDGWITMAWGDMYRMFLGSKEEFDNGKVKGAFHDGTFGK